MKWDFLVGWMAAYIYIDFLRPWLKARFKRAKLLETGNNG